MTVPELPIGDLITHFVVPGRPKAKERPRTKGGTGTVVEFVAVNGRAKAVRRRGKAHTITPTATKDAETAVGWAFRQAHKGPLIDVPVGLHCAFHGGTADGDNAFKLVSDALNGVAYTDDRLVRAGSFQVFPQDPAPRTEVWVYFLERT